MAIGRHKFTFGVSPTPTFDLTEDLWGYRYLEKSTLDLQAEPSRGASTPPDFQKLPAVTLRLHPKEL